MTSALAALRDHLASCSCRRSRTADARSSCSKAPTDAGKKAALRQLAAAFDPCHFVVHATAYDRREASEGHWLARFWAQLPTRAHTSIFFRSWYRRVLDDRLLGRIDEKSVARAFDEINEFEAQQRDYGTLIVKLYFDVAPKSRSGDWPSAPLNPWRRVAAEDPITCRRSGYRRGARASFAPIPTRAGRRGGPSTATTRTRPPWPRWRAIADAWSKAMPADRRSSSRTPTRRLVADS